MNPLSQDSSVTSSEESRMKKENSVILLDKVNHLVDSSSVDRVSSPGKYEFAGTPGSDDSKLTKSFPWITDFSKLCQTEIGLTKIHSLENLMTEYVRHVSVSVLECHLKPNRAAKLKKTMNGTLLLFHLFYSDIKKPLEHSSYLDKMSDLMAMYIDMEITASSRSKESLFKIASKLTSSLFIFLDRSHDHILDSIFKTKYMNKNFWELCNLIFVRVLRESPGRAVCDMTYVRYVLGFKMWKRVVKGVDEKRNVMKLATMRLHPPPHFRESVRAGIFSGILPKIPKSRNDITMFLMQAKFCIKEKTNAFLKQVSNSEKCGALSSYMTNFDRIPFSLHNDTDDSRLSSEEDQEDNCGNSSALMNNIWSSMSGESGVAHQIRMANIIKGKKQKSKCKKAKCKGIATPVFKTNTQQCGDPLEKLKKKRRLQQMGELAAIKPLPTSILAEKSTSPSNVTMVRPRIGIPASVDTGAVQVSSVESCQSPSVSDIKREPGMDIWIEDCKEQVNQVDSVYQGDKADETGTSVAQQQDGGGKDGSKTTDIVSSVPSPTVWVDRVKPTLEIKCESLVRSQPDNKTQTPQDGSSNQSMEDQVQPPLQDTAAYQRAALEITVAQSLINFSQSSQHDPKQEFIKKTVEKIQESGRRYHKSQIKVQKLHMEPEQNIKPKPPEAQKQNQEQGYYMANDLDDLLDFSTEFHEITFPPTSFDEEAMLNNLHEADIYLTN